MDGKFVSQISEASRLSHDDYDLQMESANEIVVYYYDLKEWKRT